MSRKYSPISLEKFQEKIDLLDGDYFDNSKIESDLSKVQFDTENMTYANDTIGFSNYPVGYTTLASDFPILFVNAGGDWEFPICFILYWDGKNVRGYIPSAGNIWNKKLKCAYGNNDSDIDEEELAKSIDLELIKDDILKRILRSS